MLGVAVPAGALYYGASRRRREIGFDGRLRGETESAIAAILGMLLAEKTPPPEPGPKCEKCSLRALCIPGLPNPGSLSSYLREM